MRKYWSRNLVLYRNNNIDRNNYKLNNYKLIKNWYFPHQLIIVENIHRSFQTIGHRWSVSAVSYCKLHFQLNRTFTPAAVSAH